MKALVVGSGGREHALAWALHTSPRLDELHAAPGNPGIAELADCHSVGAGDAEGLAQLCRQLGIDLAVVGPEAPLVAGLADRLRAGGVSVFGPGAGAARIEGSKAFAKEVMRKAGVPPAAALERPRAPCVVKADGLAAGKGVFVCRTDAQLAEALTLAERFGGSVVVEELLEGDEVSLLAVCDGREVLALPPARDYKRAYDGDEGPNTGGMGAYSPLPELSPTDLEQLLDLVHRPVVLELGRRGTPFVGILFAGLMLTATGPRVLEFNCRFGDPETQCIVPRLEGDLLETLAAAAAGDLGRSNGLDESADAAVTVVIASRNYPDASDSGTPVAGVTEVDAGGALVFHAGTARRGDCLVTNGGRILNVTGRGYSLAEARDAAYEGASRIWFDGMRFRRDIAVTAAEAEHVG